MGEDRLPRRIMRHQIENNMPWIRKLEDILERVEHEANLVDVMPINLKAFKIRVEENWHQMWRYMADDKPKLRTYMKWKEYPIPELHTTNKLLKYHRSLIIKLLLGVLPIRVESGRYDKVPFIDRTCPSCEGNIVETEEHFLFHCPLYESKRVQIMREMRRGFLMREMEAKEAQYRENWLARQSRATQAEAALVGTEALKRSW